MDIQLKPRPWYVRHLYRLLAGIAFLGFAVYVTLLAFGPRRLMIDANEYNIVNVQELPFMEYIDVEGVVCPIQTIRLNVMESGYVERIVAEDGAMLQAGDTILVLSNPELLRTIDEEAAIAGGLDLTYIIDAYNRVGMGDKFFTSFFEKLIGRAEIRQMIEQGLSAEQIRATWAEDVEQFKNQRRPYLLYAE